MDLICFIFTCFSIFANTIFSPSLQNICTNLNTNIQFDAKQIHGEANICFRANIYCTFPHTGEYLLQSLCFEANNSKLEVHFTFKRIFACKHLHANKYLLAIISILANVCYVLF